MNADYNRCFIDTNIIVYAHDISAGNKQKKAMELIVDLWHSKKGCLSMQVLQEFYVTIVNKVKNPKKPDEAALIIKDLSHWILHTPDIDDIFGAIEIQSKYKLSFWDSLIICSARKLKCDVIFSEDLNNEQIYENILVINPFVKEE